MIANKCPVVTMYTVTWLLFQAGSYRVLQKSINRAASNIHLFINCGRAEFTRLYYDQLFRLSLSQMTLAKVNGKKKKKTPCTSIYHGNNIEQIKNHHQKNCDHKKEMDKRTDGRRD